MSDSPFLPGLRSERDALVALIGPLERGAVIRGDIWAVAADLIGYRRQLAELDVVIAWEGRRDDRPPPS
jgi:hypothetical protein